MHVLRPHVACTIVVDHSCCVLKHVATACQLAFPGVAMLRRPAAANPAPGRVVRQCPAAGPTQNAQQAALAPHAPPNPAPQPLPQLPVVGALPAGQGAAARQHCWWITFAHPYQETVEQLQLKTPTDFTRSTFLDLVKAVYAGAGKRVLEAAVFLEPHRRTDAAGNRLLHLNCLVRCDEQHRWGPLARAFRQQGVAVDFASNIKTWFDGVTYGTVASGHKPREDLDSDPLQWAGTGAPTPFAEVLPARWRGGRRAAKLTALQTYDLFVAKGIKTVTAAWALATDMSASGERGLLTSLLELRDVEGFVQKVARAQDSQERLRCDSVGRLGLLLEAVAAPCVCTQPGLWRRLATETLDNNGVREVFCGAIYKALAEGRKKKNNVFLVGPTNAAKSFLVKPLTLMYHTYTIPDGGSYQLEAILDAEVMFLNDFEWDPKESWMRWSYFKDFLEGSKISVGRPKNRGGNVFFDKDIPVVGTCPVPVQYVVHDGRRFAVHDGETSQMNSRLTYVSIGASMDEEKVAECPPCCRCVAELYGMGKPNGV